MPRGQLILIEGPPGTGRTRLTQELALQCEAQGRAHQWWPEQRNGHPLLRPYDPAAYPSADSYGGVLEVQWQNFATRSAAEDVVYLFDSALLQPGFRALLAAGCETERIAEISARLLTALEPLDPRLLYLSRVDAPEGAAADWHAWRDCCDHCFAGLSLHRLLVNASRAGPEERLAEALDFVELEHCPLELDSERGERVRGRYGDGQVDIAISLDPAGAEARFSDRLGIGDRRTLLASADGSFLVAGVDLRITPREQSGSIDGLLLMTGDPRLAALPTWLPRIDD